MSPRKNRRRTNSPQASYPICGACRQRIVFVKMTDTGASMPVDPYPDPDDGNVCATPSGGTLAGFVITKKRPPIKGYKLYRAHWGSCSAREPRRPAPAPPPEPSTLFD